MIHYPLDLHQALIQHPSATYYMRVAGTAMLPRFCPGDVLVIDRALQPRSGDVVVCTIEGELRLLRFLRRQGTVQLISDNEAFPPVTPTSEQETWLWGVVTYLIGTARVRHES